MDAAAMKKPIIQSLMESIRETDTEEYLKALVFSAKDRKSVV